MAPFLRHGEAVTLRRRHHYRRGDIVLARTYPEGRIVLHYICSVGGGIYHLMGAANLVRTEQCRECDIAACVVAPGIGRRSLMAWHRLLPVRRYLMWLYRKIGR